MRPTPLAPRLLIGVLLLAVLGACEYPEENLLLPIEPTRTVDILFVVEGSRSMCEEQKRLRESLTGFIEELQSREVDFQVAVINTDMVDQVGGQGRFRTAPGEYVDNISHCTESLPDTSVCGKQNLPAWLSSKDYNDLENPSDVTTLVDRLGCRVLTGIDGDPIGMGLEAMRQALTRPEQKGFFRSGSRLAIVFVSNQNDCSDGTNGDLLGPVYPSASCEGGRNIEDSCGSLLHPDIYNGKSDQELCASADRETLAGLVDQLKIKCEIDPETGSLCSNKLIARREYYDFLVNQVAEHNHYTLDATGLAAAADDIIIATIINPDHGERTNSTESAETTWCGYQTVPGLEGLQGYRYELFAEMFPLENQVATWVCDPNAGGAADLGTSLREIAVALGVSANSFCLPAPPQRCEEKGTCKAERCCENWELCQYYTRDLELSYPVCHTLRVTLEARTQVSEDHCFEDSDCTAPATCSDNYCFLTQPLTEGTDFTVNMVSKACMRQVGAPIEITLSKPPSPGATILATYPQEPEPWTTPGKAPPPD